MFDRIWPIAVSAAMLFTPLPATAAPQLQAVTATQATSFGLPDPIADRVLGQVALNTSSPGATATAIKGPSGIAVAPPGAPNAGRLFLVEYGNHRVLSWPNAPAFDSGQAADLVLGQLTFSGHDGAAGRGRFYGPEAAVADSSGHLWVADTENNRVLRFDPPFSNGKLASLVLGQPNFDANQKNAGGSVSANSLYFPRGLALDLAGNLYVADDSNHRVLRFSPPFTNDMNASLVIGQENFVSNQANRGVVAWKNTLNHPKGIAIDNTGNLYVAEYDNNRVTRYAAPLSNGMDASGVYGQPDYGSTIENQGGLGRASLSHPVDVAVSLDGKALFVTDQWNVRVLGYDTPLDDPLADQVYGQANFTTVAPNSGGVNATSLNEEPLGVATDASGNLYIADYKNNRLLAYDTEVVGNGSPASCTEAALNRALAGGGAIRFNCGGGTITIPLTGEKGIAATTTMNGGGKLILDGQNSSRHFLVMATLILRNITLVKGFSPGDGGSIRNDGTLVLENSQIFASRAAASGGAIISTGPLTIINSRLDANQALNGGALYPRFPGAITRIINSGLHDNYATDTTDGWGGAILSWDGAPVTIEGSEISGNRAQDGGGIYHFGNSPLTLRNFTSVHNNYAEDEGGGIHNAGIVRMSNVTLNTNTSEVHGGGLYNAGTGKAELDSMTISNNVAEFNGGGLYNEGRVELRTVAFSGNRAIRHSGGGLYNTNYAKLSTVSLSDNQAGSLGGGLYSSDAAVLSGVTLSGNRSAYYGGGFYNAGVADLTNTTLNNNTATERGGGIYNIGNSAVLYLTNVTLSGNRADQYGGGLFEDHGFAFLLNVTISGNSAGNLGGAVFNSVGSVEVKQTIVANSPAGGNCFGGVTNKGFNLTDDASCVLIQVADIKLGPLANNGGPTRTHMPLRGSPAINFVATGCPPPASDQRGAARPVGAACDVGAVEYGARLPRAYLPAVRKR